MHSSLNSWTEQLRRNPHLAGTLRTEVEKELCRRSFSYFVRRAWGIVEPSTAFVHNWHIDAICAHLEAVTRGDIKRLLINIPPRHGKPVDAREFVVTRRGRIRLGDVKVGDLALTHRGRFKPVEAIYEQGILPVLRITTRSGRRVCAADDHPFLTRRGWIEAQYLTAADVLVLVTPQEDLLPGGSVLRADPILAIDRASPTECRCLRVADDHSFTANDFAVHNSLLVSVLWPAWTWLQNDFYGADGVLLPTCGPTTRFLCTSYQERLSTRDNVKTRKLIEAPWFKEKWGHLTKLQGDVNMKTEFRLARGGFRISTSVNGFATGEGGDVVVIDDPLSANEAKSETDRENRLFWFSEVMPTRLNDQKRSARVMIMQRLHERDPSGYILGKQLDWVHLCLPMWHEPDHPFVWPGDPRKDPGEILFPQRFGPQEIDELTREMTEYAIAGQLQQRPAPRGGGMFKRHWFTFVDAIPAGCVWCRAWDLASTEKQMNSMQPDYTAGILLGKTPEGRFIIANALRFQEDEVGVERIIKAVASQDGQRVKIRLPQDPGSAGKSWGRYLVRRLAGHTAKAVPVTGSKIVRAEPVAAQARVGNILILKERDDATDKWNEPLLEQLITFPNGTHDDWVDALSDAFDELTNKKGATSIAGAW